MRMCDEMIEAEKSGDVGKCSPHSETSLIKVYCEEEFYDDLDAIQACYVPQNYCYICCDTDFGELASADREQCFQSCDEPSSEKKIQQLIK